MSLEEKYKKAIVFIETIADESCYETYENLNECNWEAFNILRELGEIK